HKARRLPALTRARRNGRVCRLCGWCGSFDTPGPEGYHARRRREMRPTRSPTPRPALHLSQRNIQARTLVCRNGPAGELAITRGELLRELVRAAGRRSVGRLESPAAAGAAPVGLAPLRRVVLADEVSRALFAEFTAHRSSDRGGEETGWALLGLRRADEAV